MLNHFLNEFHDTT